MATKRWTKEEEEFLKNNFQRFSNKELAEKFNVSEIAIQRKLARLKCHRQKQKKWTKEDETFLKRNFMKYTDAELAERFGVSEISIKRKLHRLNLSRVHGKRNTHKVNISVEKKGHSSKLEVYEITKASYSENQKIFHQIWKDEGVIKQIFKTREGNMAMRVNFKRVGEKVLIYGIEDKDNSQ